MRAAADRAGVRSAGRRQDPNGSRFHELIAGDYERARSGILAITGEEELLANDPVIRRSIQLRNP
jgi:phosphoenolpyruvate carboxylase